MIIYITALIYYLIFILRTSFRANGEIFFTLVDDAMISMRYARNLASGYGLVWNPGELPVEGYTNFSWTIWMSFIHLFPVPETKISLIIMFTGVIILLLNLWVVKLIAEKISNKSILITYIALILTAFYYPLVYWTLRGMEVGILTLFINYSILLAFRIQENFRLKDILLLSMLISLGILTRIDAIVPFLIIICFVVIMVTPRYRKLSLSILSLSLILSILGHTLFRLSYYGDALPNTYYLKITGVSIIERVSLGMVVFIKLFFSHLFLPILIILIFNLNKWRKILDMRIILLLLIFLGQCIYSIYVGGDFAEYNVGGANRFISIGMMPFIIMASIGISGAARFLCAGKSPQLYKAVFIFGLFLVGGGVITIWGLDDDPFKTYTQYRLISGGYLLVIGSITIILSTLFMNKLGEKRILLMSSVFTLIVFIFMNGGLLTHWFFHNAHMLDSDIVRARKAILINGSTKESAVIAAHAVGQISYFSHRYVVDLLGKADKTIARGEPAAVFRPGHNKWNYDYSIGKLRPDIIADNWGKLSDYLNNDNNGYEIAKVSDFYVRKDSNLIQKIVINK